MDDETDALEAFERELYQLDGENSSDDEIKNEFEQLLYSNTHYASHLGDEPLPSESNNSNSHDNKDIDKDDNCYNVKNKRSHVKRYYDTIDENASKITCYRCEKIGHKAVECTVQKNLVCYSCHEKGHLARDCQTVNLVCYNCDETGHVSRDCKMGKKCHICRGIGHLARNCPESEICLGTSKSKKCLEKFCHYCKNVGHLAKTCLIEKRSKRSNRYTGNYFEKGSADHNVNSNEKKQDINCSKQSNSKNKMNASDVVEAVIVMTDDDDKSKDRRFSSPCSAEEMDLASDKNDKDVVVVSKKGSKSDKGGNVLVHDIIDLTSDVETCDGKMLLNNDNAKSRNKISVNDDVVCLGKDRENSNKKPRSELKEKKLLDHKTTLSNLRCILSDSGDEELSDPFFTVDSSHISNINVESDISCSDGNISDNSSSSSDMEQTFMGQDIIDDLDGTHYDPRKVDSEHLASYGLNNTSFSNSSHLKLQSREKGRCAKTDSSAKCKADKTAPVIKNKDKKKMFLRKLKKRLKQSFKVNGTSKKGNRHNRNIDLRYRSFKKNVVSLD